MHEDGLSPGIAADQDGGSGAALDRVAVPATGGPGRAPAHPTGTPSRYRRTRTGRPYGPRHRPADRAGRGHWESRYQRTLLVGDFAVGLAAGGIAFLGRFGAEGTASYNQEYLIASAAFPLLFVAILAANRAYERRHLYVGAEEYQRVIRAGLWLTAGAAIVSYALEIPLARGWLLIILPAATLACLVLRFAIRKQLHHARARGQRLRRVIVVGHELAVQEISERLSRERFHGMEVVGACVPGRHDGVPGLTIYGGFGDVARAVEAADADTVIALGCPELDGLAIRRLAWQLEGDDIDLILASSVIDVAGDRTTIRPVDGLPLLHLEHPRLTGAARLVKEVVDRVGAAALVLVFAPLLITIAVWIRRTSPGPAMFRQVRTGKNGREFHIVKFRTMYRDAEARLAEVRHLNEHEGALFKIRNDPRVTPVGRWLRRYSLDELPQLLNVLRGEMSLVGPRPPLPEEVAVYAEDVHRRLAVKPGMTGLWQISGRSDLPWDEAVRLDLRYVENWSLSLDLVILLRTLTAVCRTSGAY